MKVAKSERCNTSQGNAERRLGCDEIFNNDNFTTFLLLLTVKEFCTSVTIWRSGQLTQFEAKFHYAILVLRPASTVDLS